MPTFSNKRQPHPLRTLGITSCLVYFCMATLANETTPAKSVRIIEEVVVTANRREQTLQEVAGGISVLDGNAMARNGIGNMEEYAFSIPGVDMSDTGQEKKIAIRGVSNTASSPTGVGSASPVGLYLNDTPIQGNGNLPDLSLYDLARIEVLKGPQGTLYGEGAMGGTLRMVTNKADPESFYGKAELAVGETHGGGINHFQNAMINLPISDEWALRLVGTQRADSGYVSFPNRDTENENKAETFSLRAHLDGQVGERLTIGIMTLHQKQELYQFPNAQPDYEDLQNIDTEDQYAFNKFKLISANITMDLDLAEFTSSTSYFNSERSAQQRFIFIGPLTNAFLQPITGTDPTALGVEADNEWIETSSDQNAFAQEFRLVSNSDGWFNWVAGLFYRQRNNDFFFHIDNDLEGPLPDAPPTGPGIVLIKGLENFKQVALFGEVTLDLSDTVEMVVGLRAFRENVELEGSGFLGGPFYPLGVAACNCVSATSYGNAKISTKDVVPKVSLSWAPYDQVNAYFSAANGVRSGGTNNNSFISTIPAFYQPDSLWSYEIGVKTSWYDGLLTANLAAFYMDWRDLQLQTVAAAELGDEGSGVEANLVLILNVGKSYSRGLEFEVGVSPLEGLNIAASVYAADSEITEGDDAGVVSTPAPLPQASDLSWNISVDYRLSQLELGAFTPFIHLDGQATGYRTLVPENNGLNPAMDGFRLWNLLIGLESERWSFTVGVKNITDERPQLGSNILEPDTRTIGRPRTITGKLSFEF
jgi:iron complex outermembrane receptor protein